jgi:hypothetical protein
LLGSFADLLFQSPSQAAPRPKSGAKLEKLSKVLRVQSMQGKGAAVERAWISKRELRAVPAQAHLIDECGLLSILLRSFPKYKLSV